MSTRTAVTLDRDVLERIKLESRARGELFKDTLNSLLRAALPDLENRPKRRTSKIEPFAMAYRRGLNHDTVESMIQYGEGELHR
jgi:hypothetical protein